MDGEKFKYYDYFVEDDDSDIEGTDSSEDDIDIILQGSRVQKRRLSRSMSGQESSESDFEKEMRQELDEHVTALEAARCTPDSASISNNDANQGSSGTQKYSDDVYFDSDEEEMVVTGDERVRRKKKKKKILSNDELLYDPDMDDEDQKWVDKHRRSYQPKPKHQENKPTKLPKSDAVLDCPACMTTLCLDCQRHDIYQGQYRAMFVMNCNVDKNELLKYPNPTSNKKKKKEKKKGRNTGNNEDSTEIGDTSEGEVSDEKLHPVRCTECNTVVAVFDHEEVYHFFNVLASH